MSGDGGPLAARGTFPFGEHRSVADIDAGGAQEWPAPGVNASRDKALAAAHAAQEAAAELVRFVREGPMYRRLPFGDIEVVEMLADALAQTLEIESVEHDVDGHPDDAEARNQLLGAVKRFLDGWVP